MKHADEKTNLNGPLCYGLNCVFFLLLHLAFVSYRLSDEVGAVHYIRTGLPDPASR